MKKVRYRRFLHLLRKDPWLRKWIFIFIQGCLLRGGILSLIATTLIELSYSSFEFNELFFIHFPSRLLINSAFLMLAGFGLGHWLWSIQVHQKELASKHSCKQTIELQ